MSNWFSEAGPQTRSCYCDKLKGQRTSKHCDCSSGKCVPRAKSISGAGDNLAEGDFKTLAKPEGIIVSDKEAFFSEEIKNSLSKKSLETYASLLKTSHHYSYSTSLNQIAQSQNKSYTGGIKEALEELKNKGYINYQIDGTGVSVQHLKKISYSNKTPPPEYRQERTSLDDLPKASREIMKAIEASENKELITTTRLLAEKTGCSSLQDIFFGIKALVDHEYIRAIKTSKGTILSKISEPQK